MTATKDRSMPDAQIPVMIMTPNKKCIQIEKLKSLQHPCWEPHMFDYMEFSIDKKEEANNETARRRMKLI